MKNPAAMAMEPVFDPRGERVHFLYLRGDKESAFGRSWYWVQQIRRRRYKETLPMPRLLPGQKITLSLVAEARAQMRAKQEAALSGRLDALAESRAKQSGGTVAELLALYLDRVAIEGHPRMETARSNAVTLRRVLSAAGLNDSMSVADLSGDVLEAFIRSELADDTGDSTRRSIRSTLTQVRSVFKPLFREAYARAGLNVAKIDGFLARCTFRAAKKVVPEFTQMEVDLLKGGRVLASEAPTLYPVWLLGYACGLRAGEIAQARPAWLKKHIVTEVDRAGAAWLAERNFVWILDLRDPDARFKTATSAGVVPVADDVAAELERIGKGREFFVDGAKRWQRYDRVTRQFPEWLRGKGWTRDGEYVQALRQYRFQVWRRTYGTLAAKMWKRDAIQGTDGHYDSGLYLTSRPLTLRE